MSEKVAGCRDKKKKASGRAAASIKDWCVRYNEKAAYPETAYSYDDIDRGRLPEPFRTMTPEGVWPLSVKKEAPERTEKELKNSAETR